MLALSFSLLSARFSTQTLDFSGQPFDFLIQSFNLLLGLSQHIACASGHRWNPRKWLVSKVGWHYLTASLGDFAVSVSMVAPLVSLSVNPSFVRPSFTAVTEVNLPSAMPP